MSRIDETNAKINKLYSMPATKQPADIDACIQNTLLTQIAKSVAVIADELKRYNDQKEKEIKP